MTNSTAALGCILASFAFMMLGFAQQGKYSDYTWKVAIFFELLALYFKP